LVCTSSSLYELANDNRCNSFLPSRLVKIDWSYIRVSTNFSHPLSMADCTIWWNMLQLSILCPNESCNLQYIRPCIDGSTWWSRILI
jgi:hypothetical protein